MAFIYVVYVDQLMLVNEIVNVITLTIIWFIQRRYVLYGKVILASVIGTIIGFVVFMCVHQYWLYLLLQMMVVIPVMLYIAIGSAGNFRKNLMNIILCLGLYICIAGSVQGINNIISPKYNILIAIIPGSLITMAIAIMIMRMKRRNTDYCSIILKIDCEQWITLTALKDSGNRLLEPYEMRPVSIVSQNVFEQYDLSDVPKLKVPITTATGTHQMLTAIVIYGMVIEKMEEIRPCVIALTEDEIFADKEYKMILHERYIR